MTLGGFCNNKFYLYTLNWGSSTATPYAGDPSLGDPGDKPIIGDWDGDGDDDIGVFRAGADTNYFYLDLGLTGDVHECGPYSLGNVGDEPLVGDWNGNGYDNLGVYRPEDNTFHPRPDLLPTPGTPSNPSPSNHATDVTINTNLDWSDCSNTDFYDVYFGTYTHPPYYGSAPTSNYPFQNDLDYNTKYYWKIVAKSNCGGNTSGPIWDFNTIPPQRTITFYTDPTAGGRLTFDGSIYSNGQSMTKPDGTYSVSANPASNYAFGHWSTTGGMSVANPNAQSTTATVSGDGTLKAWFSSVAQTGSISVSSSPSGANIYLDGSFRGQTPHTITNVPAGVHTIGLSLAGYQDWSTNVGVTAGETSYVYATLSPIPNPSLAAAVFRNGLWILPPNYRFNFGMSTDIPITGDWNDNDIDTIGVRRGRQWILSNSNAAPSVAYRVIYGLSTDIPVVGDWNGDGVDTIGVRRGRQWILSNNNEAPSVAIRVNWGMDTDIPVVGDWNGDGKDTLGLRRGRQWILSNSNTAPVVAYRFNYGLSTDIPVVGDWNGDGVDTIGVRRGRQWILSNSNTAPSVAYRFNYGLSTDIPVTGNWI